MRSLPKGYQAVRGRTGESAFEESPAHLALVLVTPTSGMRPEALSGGSAQELTLRPGSAMLQGEAWAGWRH